MKYPILIRCLAAVLLLLIIAIPFAAATTITSISPKMGYKGDSTTVTITGTDINASLDEVLLRMDDENDILASIASHDTTTIVCTFTLSSSKQVGVWNLVLVNDDDSEVKKSNAFTIRPQIDITSISPTYARTNNDSVKVTVLGTGLDEITSLYLYNDEYSNITATSVYAASSTKVTGTFNLDSKTEDTYDVCVMDSFNTRKCDLSFEITTDAVGSIEVASSPKGATLYVDTENKGTTPITVDDLDVGTHKLILKKSGYSDWTRSVKVTNAGITTVDADLEAITTAPTVSTPVPTTAPTTVKTTRKSTIATPTPWPSDTPTPASPVGTLVIVGAIGLALIAVRKY
ncbi:MAG: PEGA domain-containing protein [Methanoregula sp.]|jgi:hypothetical protein